MGVSDQIASGQLPCVASKRDQANILLGHMTPEALQKVSTAGDMRKDVKDTATMIMGNDHIAQKLQGMAQAASKMEKAGTDQERKAIANQMGNTRPVAPTAQESEAATLELQGLFDSV